MKTLLCLLALTVAVSARSAQVGNHVIKTEPNVYPANYDAPIPNRYLITLKQSIIASSVQLREFADYLQKTFPVEVRMQYHINKMLYVHTELDEAGLRKIRDLPQVMRISSDYMAYAHAVDTPCLNPQPNPRTWGLDRIDQRGILTDPATDPPNAMYDYGSTIGNGENALGYIGDTGIELSHPEFGGRAVWGWTAPELGEGDFDGNGHGTHTAGTTGSAAFGVAKAATLIAVKVLNSQGSGPFSGVIAGIEWVQTDFEARQAAAAGVAPVACLSMSLGGGPSDEMNTALAAMIDAGVHASLSAGNGNANACVGTPSGLPAANTIGASQSDDWSATFTDWGLCVNCMAPGVNVVSTYINGGTASFSGTSMSCPHVTGVILRFGSMAVSSGGNAPAPSFMQSYLEEKYTRAAITFRADQENTRNMLLFVDCEVPTAAIP